MNRRDDNNLFKKPKKVAYFRSNPPGFKSPSGSTPLDSKSPKGPTPLDENKENIISPVFKIANGGNNLHGSKIPKGGNPSGFKKPNGSKPPEFKSPSGPTPLDSKSTQGPTPLDTKYPTYGSKFA